MSQFNSFIKGLILTQIFGLVTLSNFGARDCSFIINTPVGTSDGDVLKELKSRVFPGTPMWFEITSYIVNNTQRQSTDTNKFRCGHIPYPDERKYICLRQQKGIIKIRNRIQFWRVYAGTTFEIVVKVYGSSRSIGLCVLKIYVGSNITSSRIPGTSATTTSAASMPTTTATTTKMVKTTPIVLTTTPKKLEATKPSTQALSSSTLATTKTTSTLTPTTHPCTSAQYIAFPLKQCKPINMELNPKINNTSMNFDIESGLYLTKVSHLVVKEKNLTQVANKVLRVKLFAVVGSSNELIKEIKAKVIKDGQNILIDEFLPKNSTALSLELFVANRRILVSESAVSLFLSTFEFCRLPNCISLYNVWMNNFSNGICAQNMTVNPVKQFDTCFDMCASEQTLVPSTGTTYDWPRTKSGTTAKVACKKGSGFAIRSCKSRKQKAPVWEHVTDTECKSIEKQRGESLNKLKNVPITAKNASEAAQELKNLTNANPASLPPRQLVQITGILEQLSAFATDEKVADEMLETVDNCMQASDKSFLQGEKTNNMSSRMVSLLSTVCEAMVQGKSEFKAVKKGFALAGARQNKTSFQGLTISYKASSSSSSQASLSLEKAVQSKSDDSSSSIVLPADLLLSNQVEAQTFLFIAYDSGKLFQERGRDRLNSKIISAEVKNNKISSLKNPIVTRFKSSNASSDEKLCAWWDFTLAAGQGGWSQSGCKVHKVENGYTTCHCNHLTNFAVLLGAKTPVKGSAHEKALSIVSYVGVAISLAGVLFTLLSYSIFSKLRDTNPPKILMNLCAALALLLIIYAAGLERTKPREGCQTVAFLLQYSILCVLSWSAIEGFNSYRGIVKPMRSEIPKLMRKAAIVGWGAPVIFPVIGISAWTDKYGDSNSCVVRGLPLYTTLIVPVAIVMLFNLVAIFCILSALNKSSKMYSHNAIKMLHRVRIIVAFVLLFSLTWLFGFLVVSSDVIALQYIFCILNSLQGFFIFLFYCVRNENVRKSWKEKFGTTARMSTSTTATKKTDSSFDSAIYNKTDSLKSDFSTNKNGSIDSSTKLQLTSRANIYANT